MSDTNVIKRTGVKDIIAKNLGVLPVVGMFYAMCCAGPFGIEEMIPEAGPGLTIIILIVLPFVWALPYSFICAELGSARPVEGGSIIWVKEGLGEFWYGNMLIIDFIWSLVCNTLYVVLAVDYLGTIVEMNNYQAYAIKVAMILIFFIINVLGVKEVGWTSTILSIAVIGIFTVVAIVGFANMQSNPMQPFMSDGYDGNIIVTLGAGLGIGMWMYSGFDEISIVAGEVKDAYRVIPRAIMIVIPLMILTYVLPTLAALGSVGEWDSWTLDFAETGAVTYQSVFEQYTPKIFSIIFVVVAILAQCSIFNICLTVGGRTGLILADENFGPKILARLSSSRGVPVVGLTVVIIPTLLLLGTPNHQLNFVFLVLIDVFFGVVIYALTVVAAMVLKRKIPDDEVPFKTPGGKVGHTIAGCLVLFFCVALVLTNGIDYFIGGMIILLFIPILFVITKRIWKGATVKEPKLYPIDPRTGLGFGDITKLGGYYSGLGIFGMICNFFLQWYEDIANAGYWITQDELLVDEYAQEVIEDFPELITETAHGNIWIPSWYEMEYDGMGIFSDLDGMLDLALYISIGSILVGICLLIFGRMLKKNEKQLKAE